MGAIGLIDDYIKTFKKDKEGLKGRFKIAGQLVLGLLVGSVLYFHPVRNREGGTQDVAQKNRYYSGGFYPRKKIYPNNIPSV